jgi:hypothetical protein
VKRINMKIHSSEEAIDALLGGGGRNRCPCQRLA